MLDGKTDDEMEARALINANSLVDIYSGSWGPNDNGLMVDGPGVMAQIAFEIGTTKVIVKRILFNNIMIPSTKMQTKINDLFETVLPYRRCN